MSLEGPLEINLLGADNLQRSNVGARAKGMHVLDRLPWDLGEGRYSWPAPRFSEHGLTGRSDVAFLRVFPEGPRIATIEAVTAGLFGTDTSGLSDWPTVKECRAWSIRRGQEVLCAAEDADPHTGIIWRIDTLLFTVLRGWGEHRARATRATLRRQLALRFHTTRRAMTAAAGIPERVEALQQSLKILDHTGATSVEVAEAMWQDDPFGHSVRRFAIRYPMAFALVARPRCLSWMWGRKIAPMLSSGARERDVLAVIERECREFGIRKEEREKHTAVSVGRRRQIFAVNRNWVRRYEKALALHDSLWSSYKGHSGAGDLADQLCWVKNQLLIPVKRPQAESPEQAALTSTLIRYGIPVQDVDRAREVFMAEGRRWLITLENRDEAPKGLEGDARRFGVPLRTTPRREALAGLDVAAFVMREARDATSAIHQMLLDSCVAYDEQNDWRALSLKKMNQIHEQAGRVWDRLWGRSDGQGGSYRKLVELARLWSRTGEIVNGELLAVNEEMLAAVRWESPVPALSRRRGGVKVEPVVDGRTLAVIGKEQRHCAGALVSDFVADECPTHAYRISGKDGRSTLLGIQEEIRRQPGGGVYWVEIQHAGFRNRRPNANERAVAAAVLAALNKGRLRQPYSPSRAKRRRQAAQEELYKARQANMQLPFARARAMCRALPGISVAVAEEGVQVGTV